MAKRRTHKSVEVLTHDAATRRNIPTAEHEPVMAEYDRSPVEVAYERRKRDLDPQLVWRGKDEQNWSDLMVQAPPLFIQEKVHPKALINDLLRHSKTAGGGKACARVGISRRPLRRFQRPAERRRPQRVLPARRQLVEPDDSRRQPAGDGVARRARRAARQGAVHLSRPALWHQVQLELPVVSGNANAHSILSFGRRSDIGTQTLGLGSRGMMSLSFSQEGGQRIACIKTFWRPSARC